VTKEYWRLCDSASGHSSNEPADISPKHSSALMHCLLSLSAALQQLGVVLLASQKRDEITRKTLYSFVEALVDPAVKSVSEAWHRSNLLFVRKMLDTWDPTWPQATNTWETRLNELTSVRFVIADYPNLLIFLSRITRASRLNHSSLTCLHGPKCCWRSYSRHRQEVLTRLLLYCASANLQGGRSTTLPLMWSSLHPG